MFIKKIEIENVLIFENKTTLDLKQNTKNLEQDFVSGFFKKNNNKSIMSPLVAIAGRNASGKSTLLELISQVLLYFSSHDYTSSLVNNLFNNLAFKQEFVQTISMFNRIDFDSIYKIFLNRRLESIFGIKEYYKVNSNDIFLYFPMFLKNDESEKKIINKLIDGLEKKYNDIFYSLKSTKDINSSIVITFDSDKYGEFTVSYFDILSGRNDFTGYNINIELKNKKSNIDNFLKDFISYCNNFVYLNLFSDSLSTTNENVLNIAFTKLLSIYNKEDVISIINICDNSIDNFVYTKNYDYLNRELINVEHFINKDGKIIYPFRLSSGTKKFIMMFSTIVHNMRNSDSILVLIDEIENCFHNEIVNFIKKFILVGSTYRDIQLFFTSHSPQALSSFISSKQVYYIETKPELRFIKVSTHMNKNNSLLKQLIEKKIGEHPSDDMINQQSVELYFSGFGNA